MNARTQATMRVGHRGRGLTVAEALVLVGTLVLLAALLLPVLTTPTSHINYTRCKSRLGQLYKGVRMYLNDFDEFFPAAWHVAGEPRPDLSNVSYHRFGVHEHANSSFSHVVQSGQTPAATTAGKFKETRMLWQGPAQGWTSEYFAPEIVFRESEGKEIDGAFDKHAQYNSLVSRVSSTQRPILTDVDAAYAAGADAFGTDPSDYKSGTHKTEVDSGWQITTDSNAESGKGIFKGIGSTADGFSQRSDGTTIADKMRFDFRHNGSINIIFLDSHVSNVRDDDGQKLEYISDRWDNMKPQATTTP